MDDRAENLIVGIFGNEPRVVHQKRKTTPVFSLLGDDDKISLPINQVLAAMNSKPRSFIEMLATIGCIYDFSDIAVDDDDIVSPIDGSLCYQMGITIYGR